MTILPKKKTSQGKNEPEASDPNSHHGSHHSHQPIHNPTLNENRDGVRLFPGRNSPPRWPPPSSREEKRPAHASASGFEDYDALDSGPSHSKRRHRASPHRSARKHREHRTNTSGNSNPSVALPSTSNSSSLSGSSSPPPTPSEPVTPNHSEDYSGYNSGDEYVNPPHLWLTEEEWTERERMFEKKMRKKGYIIKKMGEDGACLFRAVADQVYGDQEMHALVRKHCMDYMVKNVDYFSQYVTEDFETYVTRKRMDHIHGNHVEMQALSEMYNRTMELYHYSVDPINIIRGGLSTDNEPIRISYHKNTHYNSIVDPHKATIGVGLGLPGFVPGLADKTLVTDAIRQSEDLQLEQAMLEDKLKATDWEATNEAIEEQVARESYLQWLRDNEKRAQKQGVPRSATATSSSSLNAEGRSPCNRSPRNRGTNSAGSSPARDLTDDAAAAAAASLSLGECSSQASAGMSSSPARAGTSGMNAIASAANPAPVEGACAAIPLNKDDFKLIETATFMNQLPPDVFGLTEWEDANILAQVLAASQQEYLDSLKRSASKEEGEHAEAAKS